MNVLYRYNNFVLINPSAKSRFTCQRFLKLPGYITWIEYTN